MSISPYERLDLGNYESWNVGSWHADSYCAPTKDWNTKTRLAQIFCDIVQKFKCQFVLIIKTHMKSDQSLKCYNKIIINILQFNPYCTPPTANNTSPSR